MSDLLYFSLKEESNDDDSQIKVCISFRLYELSAVNQQQNNRGLRNYSEDRIPPAAQASRCVILIIKSCLDFKNLDLDNHEIHMPHFSFN